jgi:uncharacterized protein with GYD domain
MPHYVLLTKLSRDLTRKMKDRAAIGEAWKQKVDDNCPGVNWVAHYAIFGPWDFLDVYEAPDDETAAKVSMITLSEGATAAETWNAIPYQRFLELVGDVF